MLDLFTIFTLRAATLAWSWQS